MTKIAVLGGGHGSCAAVTDPTRNGHEDKLWRRARKRWKKCGAIPIWGESNFAKE